MLAITSVMNGIFVNNLGYTMNKLTYKTCLNIHTKTLPYGGGFFVPVTYIASNYQGINMLADHIDKEARKEIISCIAENIKMKDDINNLSQLQDYGISKKIIMGMYSIVNEVIKNSNTNKKILMHKSSLSNADFEYFVGDLDEFKEIIGVELPECENEVVYL